jgi:hypothetical protein
MSLMVIIPEVNPMRQRIETIIMVVTFFICVMG